MHLNVTIISAIEATQQGERSVSAVLMLPKPFLLHEGFAQYAYLADYLSRVAHENDQSCLCTAC